MELTEFMTREKGLIEDEIAVFMDRSAADAPVDPLVRRAVENLAEFTLRDGKRVRPILMVIGYRSFGGEDLPRIRRAAVSMELVQSMLLIHDDLMDGSDMRRGGPSFHRMFGEGASLPGGLGPSMAIIGGDLAESLAESAIAGSGFPPGKCLKAVRAMAEMVRDTGYGQMMDVSLGGREEAGEAEIEMLQRYKTAIYTFDGPLRIGAILAGASEAELGTLRGYGIPVGISFQIIDDLLGFFGDRKRGGASDISDLKEGKRTKVLLDLVRICNEDERAFLRAKVGSRDLTLQDAEGIRDLARKYAIDALSREKARKKVDEGIAALEGADLEASMKGYLVRMAQDLLSRA